MPTTIELSGFKEFQDKCDNLDKELLEEFDLECEDASRVWAGLAKQSAPKDQGLLVGSISNHQNGIGDWETTSPVEYSAFLEWGTRSKVNVPADLSEYASQFKGGGSQGDAKTLIYAWCKRKGIDQKFWWPIFISIMVSGINPHPFFFIQVPIVEKQFVERCQNILNTEH